MRRMQCVPEEHRIFVMPTSIFHQHKIDPFRFIGKQRLAFQIQREYPGKIAACLFIRHFGETALDPGLRITLDNEGAGLPIEFIRMGTEYPGLGLAKCQGQSMKQLPCAEPDIFVRPGTQIRLEIDFKSLSDKAVQAIGPDQQIAFVFERIEIRNLLAKIDAYSQVLTPMLQDLQQVYPRNSGKTVAMNRDLLVAMDYVDIVPGFKVS